jgi:dextranase
VGIRVFRIALCILMVGLGACTPNSSPNPIEERVINPVSSPNSIEEEVMSPVFNKPVIQFSKAMYQPGQPVDVIVDLQTRESLLQKATLRVEVTHLNQVLKVFEEVLEEGKQSWKLAYSWMPPLEAPQGYGLDVSVLDSSGNLVTSVSDGFDVLNRWTETPRYGFLVNYAPGRKDAAETMEILTKYHINGLQFYDWMYRHEQFLTDEEPYQDLLGRELSFESIKRLIRAAHNRNIAAMPYTAVYGASKAFYEEHPDWVVYQRNGQPHWFGEDFMVIMDPRPQSAWTNHLMQQFASILDQTEFDGIHLDQYGDPKTGYDAAGNSYPLDEVLAAMINETKIMVEAKRDNGAVVFNAVTNWPIEKVAPANQDLVYIEVWAPYTNFNELGQLVVQAQNESEGKPVVIAAYIDPAHETNALLMDVIIFSNGGSRIELGEKGGYLADPYFPKYKQPSAKLSELLQRYYAFTIRYQDWFGPRTTAEKLFSYKNVKIEGYETNPAMIQDKIMVVGRRNENGMAISLVNMLGIGSGQWTEVVSEMPQELQNLKVNVKLDGKSVQNIYFASPDIMEMALQAIPFEQNGTQVTFQVPDLKIWSLLMLEWSK